MFKCHDDIYGVEKSRHCKTGLAKKCTKEAHLISHTIYVQDTNLLSHGFQLLFKLFGL